MSFCVEMLQGASVSTATSDRSLGHRLFVPKVKEEVAVESERENLAICKQCLITDNLYNQHHQQMQSLHYQPSQLFLLQCQLNNSTKTHRNSLQHSRPNINYTHYSSGHKQDQIILDITCLLLPTGNYVASFHGPASIVL